MASHFGHSYLPNTTGQNLTEQKKQKLIIRKTFQQKLDIKCVSKFPIKQIKVSNKGKYKQTIMANVTFIFVQKQRNTNIIIIIGVCVYLDIADVLCRQIT